MKMTQSNNYSATASGFFGFGLRGGDKQSPETDRSQTSQTHAYEITYDMHDRETLSLWHTFLCKNWQVWGPTFS